MTWTIRPRSDFGGLTAVDEGDGPLIVMLHGVGLRAEAWGAQIEPLVSEGYRVVCPDMPGHGEAVFSARDELANHAQAVAAALTEPALIVGHSMGALLAVEIAAADTGQVRGIAALNAIYRRSPQARQAVLARAHSLSDQRPNDPTVTLLRWFADADAEERAACARWLRDVEPSAYKAAYTLFAESDGPSDAQLAGILCPALFLTGGDEPNSTPRMSRDMAGLAPQGRAEIIPNAAHMMPMTHADEVNGILLPFIQECLS